MVSEQCMKCLDGVWMVSEWCMEGLDRAWIVSGWYLEYLDSVWMVETHQKQIRHASSCRSGRSFGIIYMGSILSVS